MLLKIVFGVFAAIIGIALLQYQQARVQQQRHKISQRIARAVEDGNAGRHDEACRGYNEMLHEALLIDDWSNEILKRECFKAMKMTRHSVGNGKQEGE